MAQMTRLEELVSLAHEFTAVHHRWANDPSLGDSPTITYWEALRAMGDAFLNGDIPHEVRKLADAVEELVQQADIFDNEEHVIPTARFWAAREAVENAIVTQEREFPEMESVQELHRQGVEHEQIARMYGLVDGNGNPRTSLVRKELDKPGSVIGPDFVTPEQAERNRVRDAGKRAADRIEQARTSGSRPPAPACPETPEELFLQDVTVAQAANMLGWTVERTDAAWTEFAKAKKLRDAQDDLRIRREAEATAGPAIAPAPAKTSQEVREEEEAAEKAAASLDGDAAEVDDDDWDEDEEEEDNEPEAAPAAIAGGLPGESEIETLRRQCREAGIGLSGSENRTVLRKKLEAVAKK